MSRIYDNKPLQTLPVEQVKWTKSWPPDAGSGKGILLEAVVERRSKYQLTDGSQNKHRYTVLHVSVERAARRQYDAAGVEVEPNFGQEKKVRTGYLHSSYKNEAKGVSDILDKNSVGGMLSMPELDALCGATNPQGCVPLWVEESLLANIEVSDKDHVRVKTRGDTPLVETFARLEGEATTVVNYAGGEGVGMDWTQKVMKVKSQCSTDDRCPSELGEGAADDEWDD